MCRVVAGFFLANILLPQLIKSAEFAKKLEVCMWIYGYYVGLLKRFINSFLS